MRRADRQHEEFEEWMERVDAVMLTSLGIKPDDYPDEPWWDWFLDKLTPEEAVDQFTYQRGADN